MTITTTNFEQVKGGNNQSQTKDISTTRRTKYIELEGNELIHLASVTNGTYRGAAASMATDPDSNDQLRAATYCLNGEPTNWDTIKILPSCIIYDLTPPYDCQVYDYRVAQIQHQSPTVITKEVFEGSATYEVPAGKQVVSKFYYDAGGNYGTPFDQQFKSMQLRARHPVHSYSSGGSPRWLTGNVIISDLDDQANKDLLIQILKNGI